VPGAVRLFEARDLEVRVGDPILWRTNDPGRGIVNSGRAVLAEVDKGEARFLMADGRVLTLPTEDPVLKRIDLAYALNAHAAQGATADKAIIVARADEGPLISQPLLAVLFTRPRDAVDLITDRLDALMGRAGRNSGEKLSATEIAGKPVEPKQVEMTLPPPEPEKPVQRVPEKYRDMEIGW
jgi:ATP-dependent exoDNAse (exonuclease V) alpha subunit